MKLKSDIQLSLVHCHHCGALQDEKHTQCLQCHSDLHQRKHNAYSKTLMYSLIALIFFIPANVLPMMYVTTLGAVESSTIFDGIVYFVQTKSYAIAAIIFTASIAVPLFKLVVLFYLLFIIHFKKEHLSMSGQKYFRIIHFIGKWSMIDIFVVALMTVMVQFGNLSTIVPGEAAISFTIVVIMTIFATESFDTRLLWDIKENHE